ncbi:MAG: UDP-N-acetylmuramoyl-tripeptide--D-alanyl-D-alanine ligase [bacterium]|nr:UDP-N-acetylmuramoyl-tripeptide--D-alanyl-D-alanine ligase [bacterium]
MKISEIIKATNSVVIKELEKALAVNISTDTRTIQEGDFYLPLKGASFDGEKFVSQAIEKGAVGVFVTQDTEINMDCCILKVEDTLKTYLELANYRRNKFNPIVVAVTGSSGKTTTKELVSSVLSEKFRTFKTPLNHNNEIGFCQTVFEAPCDTEVLVLEMGMRGLGEIELLSKYSEPDITIIANVGTAHIGRLGSRENIAKAKCEIVKFQRGNTFIAHNDELIKQTVDFNGEKIYYSINDVKILEKSTHYSKFEYKNNIYELNVGGDYNIENALSAINTGIKLGLTIQQIQEGLKKYHPIEKRWEAVSSGGYEIVNDSYNANPESMRAFADTIFELYDNYVLVLGDMGELGDNEVKYHKQLGQYINGHKLLKPETIVISVGNLSENMTNEISNCKAIHFDEISDAVKYIKSDIKQSEKIFLKASRSMKFEKIIEELGRE